MRHAAPRRNPRAAVLFGLYLTVCLAPLGLSFTELMPGRGLVVNFSIALGFVALAVLGLQFVLVARFARLLTPFGIDAILRYHRQITSLAVLAAIGHPLLLFLASSEYRPLLDVVHDPLRAKLAWGAIAGLALLIVTSIWRRLLRLSYTAWHILHSLLGVLIVVAALAHAFLVDYYMSATWERVAWLFYAAAFLWLAVWVRLVRPLRLGLHPWRVTYLWPEPSGALTVGVEPATRHKERFSFRAGQFAWLLHDGSPFALTYNPFSMSSSAEADRVEFTIAPVGDMTSSLRRIRVGDRVYLDGPHGSFTLERHPAPGYVFLATGVGVTPFLSMLSTMVDRGDRHPCWLFLGNRFETKVTGIRQLARIVGRVRLTIVHVISRPSRAWDGETGHIRAEVLRRHLPAHYRSLSYFICADPKIARSLARMLRRDLGISAGRIHVEEFRLA